MRFFAWIVSWCLFFAPLRRIAYRGERREGVEAQWSRQVATFPRDVFKYGWREKELKASQEAPLKPSNLVWNHRVRALWSEDGQAAALQPAISPHYHWGPHPQHRAPPSTWPPLDLLAELIFRQIRFALCPSLSPVAHAPQHRSPSLRAPGRPVRPEINSGCCTSHNHNSSD